MINKAIEKYLANIDQTDQEEKDLSSPSDQELQKKIERLESSKEGYMQMIQEMDETGESQVSLSDPDSRSFPKKFGVAVDDKHHLIVEQEVTNSVTDIDQLSSMAIKAKETLWS